MRLTVRAGVFVALTVAALFALACESLLGIDGRYVTEPGATLTGGAPGASGGSTGGTTDGPATGGVPPPSGGTSPNETGGAPPDDAGCDGECEPSACRPGHYAGTFRGEHNPVNIPGIVTLFEVTGTVEFDLKADAAGHLGVSGMLLLVQQQQPPSFLSQFQAKIQGELDCGTAELDAKLTEGKLTPVLLPSFEFEGSLTGAYESSTHTVSGDWNETQIPATQPTGNGTWTATWARP